MYFLAGTPDVIARSVKAKFLVKHGLIQFMITNALCNNSQAPSTRFRGAKFQTNFLRSWVQDPLEAGDELNKPGDELNKPMASVQILLLLYTIYKSWKEIPQIRLN